MLEKIGVESVDGLFKDVPADKHYDGFDLPGHMPEMQVERHIAALGRRNLSPNEVPCFLGGGAYRHHIPASVDHLIQRGEFLTSYTPYQPEISQGTLQALFEFQTQVALLTGMEVANASMYDGASGCAEAVLMARRVTRRSKAILSGGLHPHYADVTVTQSRLLDVEVDWNGADVDDEEDLAPQIDDDTACVVVQNPSVFGHVRDLTGLADACHDKGALLVVVVTEPVALAGLRSPGSMGADIVVGEGQGLGVALSFGGPYVGLFATRQKFVRQMPGRLCGETVDATGKRGWVLTLSTREQHIRREKATSNICTNAGLCSLAFTIHVALLGEAGLRKLADINGAAASHLAERVAAIDGVELNSARFFNEFSVRLKRPARDVVDDLAARGILAGIPATRLFGDAPGLDEVMLIAVSELNTADDMDQLCTGLAEVLA